MPVTLPAASTNAPPDDAAPDAAPVSRRPLVVGPVASATRLSVDATMPLLIQGDLSPGSARRRPTRCRRSSASVMPTARPAPRCRGRAARDRSSRRDRGPARRMHDTVGGRDVDLGRRADEPVAREDLVGTTNAHPRTASRSRFVVHADRDHRSPYRHRDRLRGHDRGARGHGFVDARLFEDEPAERADRAEHGERQDRPPAGRPRECRSTSVSGAG